MERIERDAILLALLGQLRAEGSWCGETHMQKAAFFLQDLMRVPISFDFILYKHGPFSFDLRDELTAMRADGILVLQSQEPYGPSLIVGPSAADIEKRHKGTVKQYQKQIAFVAASLGNKQVVELERLATAQFVIQQSGGASDPNALARRISALKPHIAPELAVEAVNEVRELGAKASSVK